MSLEISRAMLRDTLAILQRGGERGEERVALWLATARPQHPAAIVEVYEPEQIADVDYFRLPAATMRALLDHLRLSRRRIVAQIHTHPGDAFHSDVDAQWAIVRHVSALSLVLPRFAANTTPDNFLQQVMIYEYSPDGEWEHRAAMGRESRLSVTA
jgi:proteasome lid subunit RPN8/RPN11